MIRSAKALAWRIADSAPFRRLERLWYDTIASPTENTGTGILLITAPGGGNIGDQAMFESFARNCRLPITAVWSESSALTVPPGFSEKVDVQVIYGLFKGRPQLTPRRIRKFAQLVAQSEAVVVIGADIADGAYGLRQAWARTEALRLASRFGKKGRVIGFSWSAHPNPSIEKAYRQLAANNTELLVRDRYSQSRLAAAGIPARLTADTVFGLQYVPDPAQTNVGVREFDLTPPLAILNVSGLLAKRYNIRDQYPLIVQELRSLGYQVVIIPHVFRSSDDDLAASTDLIRLLPKGHAHLVDRPLSPNEIQRLTAQASLVISGRMHLAILGLTTQTPAIVFGTQGKVEGMLAMFGLEDFVVEPGRTLATETISRIRSIHLDREKFEAQISDRLPSVIENSLKNFEWGGLDV